MSVQPRRVLVVTAGGRRPALALFDADFLVVDVQLAERARRRFGLPIVPLADAA